MDRDVLLGIAMMALLLLVAVSIVLIAWGFVGKPTSGRACGSMAPGWMTSCSPCCKRSGVRHGEGAEKLFLRRLEHIGVAS